MNEKLSQKIRNLEVGKKLVIPFKEKSKVKTVKSLCTRFNKENRVQGYMTRISVVGERIHVIKTFKKGLSLELRQMQKGTSKVFDDVDYNVLHATASRINTEEGKEIKVERVTKVSCLK